MYRWRIKSDDNVRQIIWYKGKSDKKVEKEGGARLGEGAGARGNLGEGIRFLIIVVYASGANKKDSNKKQLNNETKTTWWWCDGMDNRRSRSKRTWRDKWKRNKRWGKISFVYYGVFVSSFTRLIKWNTVITRFLRKITFVPRIAWRAQGCRFRCCAAAPLRKKTDGYGGLCEHRDVIMHSSVETEHGVALDGLSSKVSW